MFVLNLSEHTRLEPPYSRRDLPGHFIVPLFETARRSVSTRIEHSIKGPLDRFGMVVRIKTLLHLVQSNTGVCFAEARANQGVQGIGLKDKYTQTLPAERILALR
jgi:hypothetical protein